jgi:hypothetical protein
VPSAVAKERLFLWVALRQGVLPAPGVRPAARSTGGPSQQTTTGTGVYLWNDKDDEMDDALHTADPSGKDERHNFELWSARGWLNVATIFILLAGT